jgi:flagellar motility protein MotE (MotC chaperone)
MNRREWFLAGCGAMLGLGTAGGAWAGGAMDRPSPAQVEAYCDLQQQGAVRLNDDLARRARELDARESSIAAEKSELAAAEERLAARMEELKAARAEIEALVGTADAARAQKVAGLVKMIEANRANAVSPMFEKLDDALAVEVLDKMNRSKAGKLLAALPAAKAAGLAQKMTEPLAVELP